MEYYNQVNETYLRALKQQVIQPVFKVELLDFAENIIGELTQDISKEDSGSISINYQQGVRRSCSLTLINVQDNFKINTGKYSLDENSLWINTKFKVYIGVKVPHYVSTQHEIDYDAQNNDVLYGEASTNMVLYQNDTQTKEEDIYWFSQGIFLLSDPSVLRDLSKKTITINGIDKFGVFGSESNFNQTDATYKIDKDSKLGNVITSILAFDKGNGLPLDVKQPYIDPNAKALVMDETTELPIAQIGLPFEINKSPETYFGDILIELANIYACDIYYDTEGYLRFEKGNEKISMDDFASLWDYSDKETEYFNPQLNYDFKSVYNVVKVVGNNPTAEDLFVHIAKNNNPSSPTRIQLIGEKILYIESSFCYSAERTKDFANYMLRKKSMVPLTLSFQSAFIPHLDVNKVITITDDYYNYVQQRFIIQSLTIPLSTKSLMDIECTNASVIPYFEY